jgi:VPDSG-CTERM motif
VADQTRQIKSPDNSLVNRYLHTSWITFFHFWHKVCFPFASMKSIAPHKLALLSAAFCAVMLAFAHNASAITIGDTHELGYVWPGVPSGNAQRTLFVNHLIGMTPGTIDIANGQIYHRSNNAFGSLPNAVFDHNGTGTTLNLGAGGLYTYLFATYAGGLLGSEVWFVGNLSGIITIPAICGGYGLSGWTLFGPGVLGVPDGGTTAMLLGAALGALGMARRVLKI